YYSMDSFTPLTRHSYPAARAAVDVALTGADILLNESPPGPVYSLTRPPGHHAERDLFGGFCYFNNGAIAAEYLSDRGRVALLDVDFHHGNGAQQIFYEREDILTLSIHGDPKTAYPYFVGFSQERGQGAGLGYNVNYPLPEGTEDEVYLATLRKACKRIAEHQPEHLVVALGLDVSKDDPSGAFRVSKRGFHAMGETIASLGIPTLLVQEGGYNLRHLGGNLEAFLSGWVKTLR
ncbi:MAG TPA: histone deacetylase family protein, partial [Candidatus Thermoplasmatota archaeon]|nr:histone deacetylase family protein [Candidatus Thermoplasmatota archaeon]